jgi:hypothetical protein
MLSLTAPTAPPRANRLPVDAGLVLDRSGSMDGERRFELARQAVEESLRMLRPRARRVLERTARRVRLASPVQPRSNPGPNLLPRPGRDGIERLVHDR